MDGLPGYDNWKLDFPAEDRCPECRAIIDGKEELSKGCHQCGYQECPECEHEIIDGYCWCRPNNDEEE